MNKIILTAILLLSLIVSEIIYSQINQEWVNIYNGHGSFTECRGMVMDKQSNIYVTGYSHTISGDLYVTRKYGENGSVLWHDEIRSGTYGTPYDMAIDDSDYVYITGYYDLTNQDKMLWLIKYSTDGDTIWTRKFNLGNSEEVGVSINIDRHGNLNILGWTNNDALTVKYDPTGNYLWHRTFASGSGYITPKMVATDSLCNVYIAGSIDMFDSKLLLLKYDLNGNFEWANYERGYINGYDQRKMIGIDSKNNIYLTGSSMDSASMNHILVCKYNSNSSLIWKKTPAIGQGNAIAVDHEDSPYITGLVQTQFSNDIGTVKFDSAGNLIWIKTYNQSGFSVEEGKSISINKNQNIYVLGSGYGTSFTAFVTLKYSKNGIFKWMKQYMGGEDGVKIISNDSNDVFISGKSNNYMTVKYSGDLTGINYTNTIGYNYKLYQNSPNPFNPNTTISFEIPEPELVKLNVYNISGKEIIELVNEVKNAGKYNVQFEADQLPSGIYLCKLTVGNYTQTRRMMLLK